MQQVEELQAEGSGSQQQNVGCKANQGWIPSRKTSSGPRDSGGACE